jgi:glycosyltransferase involved in cell wall biosynthesis
MQLVYVGNSAIPSRSANSINVMKMCAAFSGLGHEVVLLTPNRGPIEQDVDDIYDFYGVERSFDVRVLPWRGIAGRSFMYAFRAAYEARRRNWRLVYTRFVRGAFACALLRVPVVLEVHAPPGDGGKIDGMLFRWLVNSLQLQRVVVISEALRAHVQREHPGLENKLIVAHDAAESTTDVSIEPVMLRGNPERLKVGYVGHLYQGKGMELIAKIAERCSWADFHIVGGTRADIDRWSAELSDAENVHFYGHVPHGRTPGYLAAFQVLLAPYQRRVTVLGLGDIASWMSPLKIFEYMAAGKPIVCSDLPVLREILDHNETGIFCEPEEAADWASAIERLSRDAALMARLGDNARALLTERYSWAKRARRVLDGLI